MELIIDNRECLKKYFQEKNKESVKFENLDLGDYIFKFNDETVCVIERKTVEDLANSIKDGRYREQKSRLLENYPKTKILYLIEGDLTKSNKSIHFNKVTKSTIYSSLINVYLRDNINAFHTNNENETIEFLEEFSKKLNKQGLKFLEKKNNSEDSLFNNVKSKKKQIDPHLVYRLQLSDVPGISKKYADAIINKYPTMISLISSLKDLDEKTRILSIKNLEYKIGENKKRKLGIKVANNINKYIFMHDNNN